MFLSPIGLNDFMRKILLSLIFFALFVFSVSAQTKEARKIDEFGITNCGDYGARIDVLFRELEKFPDSKGYIFVYEGDLEVFIYDRNGVNKGKKLVLSEKGFAKNVIGYFKEHLTYRKFPLERIVFLEAGFRRKYTNELWFVPNGVSPPIPMPTLQKIKQRKPKHKKFGFCGEM